jgi:tetratricopeptide (TPR) repeat protein
MSPEQILGQPTDARSDQYSFCVSLWEGLYGSRPFAGETPAALAMQAAQGKFVGPPADTRVPARLRRILTRGLAAEREQRHPSIDALLTELARDPRHLRRRVLLTLGAAALVAVGVGVVSEIRARQRAVCSGAERKLAGIWDGPRKDAIRAAFLASGKPFAQDAWKGTERAFDAYARGFVETRTEACQATRIRGEQSEALLDVRMRCLDQRLKEMSALATLFSSADGEVVAKAVHAANAITPLEVCADVDGLTVFKRPRPDPQIRPRVDAVRAQLAEAKALRDAGKHRDGLKVAAEADREARALGYGPLEAEARYLLGSLQVQTASYRDAEQTLFDALSVAEASWQDRLRALVLRSLVEVVGVKQQRHSDAHRWARYAAASIQRLGGDPFLEALLWTNVAAALMSEGRYEEALSRARSALAIYERALGRDHPRVATELNNIGIVLGELGRYEEAERLHRRALALRVRIFGASHPDVGQSNNNLANVLMETGRLEEARQGYERALSIYEGSLGAEHPRVASALNNVGLAEVGLGELPKARLRYERALAIFTRVHGREHPNVGMARLNIGEVLGKLGQPAEALRHLQAASEILEKTRGPDHPDLAESLQAHGLLLLSQRDHAAARALFERSLAIRQKALGGNHPKLVDSLTGLAEASLELGAVARAVELLERALTIGQATKDAAPALARTRFALARALLSTAGGRARAVELARRARAEYASAGKHAEDLAKVDAWLARHAHR